MTPPKWVFRYLDDRWDAADGEGRTVGAVGLLRMGIGNVWRWHVAAPGGQQHISGIATTSEAGKASVKAALAAFDECRRAPTPAPEQAARPAADGLGAAAGCKLPPFGALLDAADLIVARAVSDIVARARMDGLEIDEAAFHREAEDLTGPLFRAVTKARGEALRAKAAAHLAQAPTT